MKNAGILVVFQVFRAAELAEKIEGMIEARKQAKAAKNYAEADRIRAELSAMGVTLVDTKDGTTYTVAN